MKFRILADHPTGPPCAVHFHIGTNGTRQPHRVKVEHAQRYSTERTAAARLTEAAAHANFEGFMLRIEPITEGTA